MIDFQPQQATSSGLFGAGGFAGSYGQPPVGNGILSGQFNALATRAAGFGGADIGTQFGQFGGIGNPGLQQQLIQQLAAQQLAHRLQSQQFGSPALLQGQGLNPLGLYGQQAALPASLLGWQHPLQQLQQMQQLQQLQQQAQLQALQALQNSQIGGQAQFGQPFAGIGGALTGSPAMNLQSQIDPFAIACAQQAQQQMQQQQALAQLQQLQQQVLQQSQIPQQFSQQAFGAPPVTQFGQIPGAASMGGYTNSLAQTGAGSAIGATGQIGRGAINLDPVSLAYSQQSLQQALQQAQQVVQQQAQQLAQQQAYQQSMQGQQPNTYQGYPPIGQSTGASLGGYGGPTTLH